MKQERANSWIIILVFLLYLCIANGYAFGKFFNSDEWILLQEESDVVIFVSLIIILIFINILAVWAFISPWHWGSLIIAAPVAVGLLALEGNNKPDSLQSIELRSKLNPNSEDPEIKLYLKRQKPRRGYEVVGKDEGTDGQKTITEYQEAHTGKWFVKSKLIRAGYTEEDLEEMRQREIRKKHKPKPKNTEKTMFNHNGRSYRNKP